MEHSVLNLSNLNVTTNRSHVDTFATPPDQRRHAAYHEAAHAVVGYYFGAWVNHEGVEIDERQYCGVRRYISTATERALVCFSLAGWGAEMRLAPDLAPPRDEWDLMESLAGAKYEPEDCADEDDASVFIRLLTNRPNATDEELFEVYRRYEADTAEILARSDVWASVERVAAALLERGKLRHEDVVPLLDDGVKDGASAL